MQLVKFLLIFIVGANAADKWYSIWPKDIADKEKNQKITDDLTSRIGGGNLHVSKSGLGNHYWYALLSDEDKQRYDTFDGVRYVALPEVDTDAISFSPIAQRARSLQKRDPPEAQEPAPDHLKIISQAEGQKFKDLKGYYYEKEPGNGITIYVIDSGLNEHNEEFPPAEEIKWLHAGPFADQVENDADTDAENGHGTCMASVAIGKKDGVAKSAELVVVKADIFTKTDKVPDANALAPERWIDALAMVYDDIDKNTKRGKAVVSMSWGARQRKDKQYDDCIKDAFTNLLTSLLKLDVPQCIAAGQNKGLPLPGDDDKPKTWPAILGESDIKDLTVVSSVDTNGEYEIGTFFADYTIAALGDLAECAKSSGSGYHPEEGTSPATAAVAGLLAYFMAQGKSGADARKQLFDKAYPRITNGPKVVWNLIDIRNNGAGGSGGGDGGDGGDITESNKCHGIDGDSWIWDRNTAVDAAKDFCGQGDTPKEYNKDTPNYLELGLVNLKDKSLPISSAPNCLDTFTNTVIDGCQGNNPEFNPHNYKFGGVYTSADGWEFSFKPRVTQTPDDSCDVAYQFWDNYFEVRGKNFPDGKLLANGDGLKGNIQACGAISEWEFTWTPGDPKFQWYSHGKLPIGTRSCVGTAVQNTGGPSVGNCWGAG